MAAGQQRQLLTRCKACRSGHPIWRGLCNRCTDRLMLDRHGACPECARHGQTHGIWAKGLCRNHHRQMLRNKVVEATGYVGNQDNRDDYNSLIQELIAAMLKVAPRYVEYLAGRGDYRHADILTMQHLLLMARAGLRERVYIYVLYKVNSHFPPGTGIPLPRDKGEGGALKEEQTNVS